MQTLDRDELTVHVQAPPEDGGTRLTGSYEVTMPIARIGWFIIGTLFGGKDRRSELHRGMQEPPTRSGGSRTQ
jgi:hypothetical protein